MTESARGQVGHGPDGEGRSRQRPGGQGPARPFDDLAEIVGAGNVPEQAALGNLVVGFIGPPQVPEKIIGLKESVNRNCQEEAGMKEKAGAGPFGPAAGAEFP